MFENLSNIDFAVHPWKRSKKINRKIGTFFKRKQGATGNCKEKGGRKSCERKRERYD